ncbi:MAG TPA: heme-degrading domain-containing protein [Ktedonobacterales bacterium]
MSDDTQPDMQTLLQTLLQEEAEIQFTEFTNDTAWRIGSRFVEVARQESLGVTIDIRRHGHQLFHAALPGTSPDNDAWIKRKIRVVNRFGHSSFYMGNLYKSQGSTIEEKALLDPTRYAPHGGAFPIIIKGVGSVGTVTVSGLPQAEDHKLVVRILREFV